MFYYSTCSPPLSRLIQNKSDEQHQDAACEVPGKEERLEAEVIALKTERDEVKEEISKVKCELHAANERIARLESALAEARSITESVTTAAPLRKKGVNFFWAKAL